MQLEPLEVVRAARDSRPTSAAIWSISRIVVSGVRRRTNRRSGISTNFPRSDSSAIMLMSEPGSGRLSAVSRSADARITPFITLLIRSRFRYSLNRSDGRSCSQIEIVVVLLAILALRRWRREDEDRFRIGQHDVRPVVEHGDALLEKAIEADVVARRPLEIRRRRELEHAIVVAKHADVGLWRWYRTRGSRSASASTDRLGVVGRRVVGDDQLEVAEALIQQILDRLPNPFGAVVDRHADAEDGRGGHLEPFQNSANCGAV